MARFMKLTVAQYKSPADPAGTEYPPDSKVLLNIDHVAAVSEGKPRSGYPDGFTMVTMTSQSITAGEGGSEVYYVQESLELISKNLPI